VEPNTKRSKKRAKKVVSEDQPAAPATEKIPTGGLGTKKNLWTMSLKSQQSFLLWEEIFKPMKDICRPPEMGRTISPLIRMFFPPTGFGNYMCLLLFPGLSHLLSL
jgi:hypothetical protein